MFHIRRTLSAVLVAASLSLASCHPQSPPAPAPADAAQVAGSPEEHVERVLAMLADGRYPGAVSVAIGVVSLWPTIPPVDRAEALRDLRMVRDSLLPDLRAILADLRDHAPGSRCRAHAITVAIVEALDRVARVVARAVHWDISTELSLGLGVAAQVADVLHPECVPGNGFSHHERDVSASRASATRLAPFPTMAQAEEAARRAAAADGGAPADAGLDAGGAR